MDDDDDNSFDQDTTDRLQLIEDDLVRLARKFHDIFAGDIEVELVSAFVSQTKISDCQIHNVAQTLYSQYGHRALEAFAVLTVERLIANEDKAAIAYKRVLSAMVAIENIEPEPGEQMH